MSRHLGVLEAAGLLRAERQGRERVYALQAERLCRVVGGWLRHFEDVPKERNEA
jgi:DNA-binding transcriptional ArsR family regulator